MVGEGCQLKALAIGLRMCGYAPSWPDGWHPDAPIVSRSRLPLSGRFGDNWRFVIQRIFYTFVTCTVTHEAEEV